MQSLHGQVLVQSRSVQVLKGLVSSVFFFFKQKTAYEISLGLVGSEMCIRDRLGLLGYLILYKLKVTKRNYCSHP